MGNNDLGAALQCVGGAAFGGLPEFFGPYLLSLCAFLGGLGGVGTLVVTGLWIKLFPGLANRDRMVEQKPGLPTAA